MNCTHNITDRDVAVSADGMCPICQMETIGRLRNALFEMLEAHSMKNIGLEASKRRLEAIKRARAALEL